ncbi:MAG: chromosome segregation protein SMC [Gammaproteobacteria bacterium]|nr:chromosome segregation protein SMC [Gammaproteobacteria bacterium]
MRLKQIKLSGFKSFVDPTTVSFPGNRSAVVGPNGCGKSNIIDAVRWVMGESSARQLRGESPTDVIFNGAQGRKPTAIANIELIFDNSDGRVGGEYARFTEIAIRRQVTRDAQSTYFLNGTKCRRRDIVDIFLGTGFGPRSYSIIEQGMISQLVEAKPEDLRIYLEEAAGISKYKERRRETENRIKHTVENLERLRDIREELDRQLQHLKRQARSAERYRDLKGDERKLTAELYVLRLDAVQAELDSQQGALQKLETDFEAAASNQQRLDTELEKSRVLHGERSDEFNGVQGRFYQLGAEIARAEEAIQYNQERVKQLELDLESVSQQGEETERQVAMDEAQIVEVKDHIARLAPMLEQTRRADRDGGDAQQAAEQRVVKWQQAWDEFSGRANLNDSDMQVQVSRIEHIEQVRQRLKSRLAQLNDETPQADMFGATETENLSEEVARAEGAYQAIELDIDACNKGLLAAREDVMMRERNLDAARTEVQTLRHELAALEAVQQAVLGGEVGEAKAWIEGQDLDRAPRLGEDLVVNNGWEHAVETVLAANLQAIKVENLADYAASLRHLDTGKVILFEGRVTDATEGDLPALATLVRAQTHQLGSLLHGVFAADSVDVALRQRTNLGAGESIITRDGLWMGPDWMRTDQGDDDQEHGIIQRGLDIETRVAEVEDAEQNLSELHSHVAAGKRRVEQLEADRDSMQTRYSDAARRLSELRTEHGVYQVRLEEADARRERIDHERSETDRQVEAESARLNSTRERLIDLTRDSEALVGERRQLTEVREREAGELERTRCLAREASEEYHALNVEHQGLLSQLSASVTARDRLLTQRADLQSRLIEIRSSIDECRIPLPELQTKLESALAERLSVEQQLTDVRRSLETVDAKIQSLTASRADSELVIEEIRGRIESARVEREGFSVRSTNLLDQIRETGITVEQAHDGLAQDATEAGWVEALEKIDRRIQRLGPINLAAIDEFDAQGQRKIYLDEQNKDLEDALETLRSAIRKIDKETRTRFKSTFDQVNEHLQKLFPKVFGGGHAYLELTGEDLLDTGVSLMARPPGKRNASIHLLSGGEKALTALALIFAIFQLNPSPVCLLDEVDAPLDDTNVLRFAELIREMSSEVQFVVITHNKLTMEMADHLMGVTMIEPGVSRLVSVDVEEAAALAAV